MQKKLLSLMMIISCSAYAEIEETVPVISDEENRQHIELYNDLDKQINESKEKTEALQKEKDKVEVLRYMYDYRRIYGKDFILEFSVANGTLDKCKQSFNQKADQQNKKRKDKDNGIDRAWFSGVTDPLPDSRAEKVYKRINNITKISKDISTKLHMEHIRYKKLVETDILPELNQNILDKTAAIDTVYIKAFQKCNCYHGNEYYECLSRLGVSKEAVSEDFVTEFINESFVSAYQKAIQNGVPAVLEEMIVIAKNNEITKNSVAKMYVAQEELKKLIRRESSNPGTSDKPEQKPHIDLTGENKEKPVIIEDPKDDQGNQGALSE